GRMLETASPLERAVCLEDDPAPVAVLEQPRPVVQRVELDLVDRRSSQAVPPDRLQLVAVVVADADLPCQSLLLQRLELAPVPRAQDRHRPVDHLATDVL